MLVLLVRHISRGRTIAIRAHLFVCEEEEVLVGITHQPPTSQPSFFFASLLSGEGVLCPSAIQASVGTHLCTHFFGAYLRPKALRVAFIFVAVNLSSLQAVIRDRVERRRYCGETGSTTIHSYLFRDIHRWFNSVLLACAFDLHQLATIFAPIGCLLLHPCALISKKLPTTSSS